MVLSVSASVVLEVTMVMLLIHLNKTNIIILYWFGKTYVHCMLESLHLGIKYCNLSSVKTHVGQS